MGNGSGVSRGDRNRNARLERLRCLVPVRNAMAGSIWQARSRWLIRPALSGQLLMANSCGELPVQVLAVDLFRGLILES